MRHAALLLAVLCSLLCGPLVHAAEVKIIDPLTWLIDGNTVCLEPGDSCASIEEFLAYGVHEITLRASDPAGAVGEVAVFHFRQGADHAAGEF